MLRNNTKLKGVEVNRRLFTTSSLMEVICQFRAPAASGRG